MTNELGATRRTVPSLTYAHFLSSQLALVFILTATFAFRQRSSPRSILVNQMLKHPRYSLSNDYYYHPLRLLRDYPHKMSVYPARNRVGFPMTRRTRYSLASHEDPRKYRMRPHARP